MCWYICDNNTKRYELNSYVCEVGPDCPDGHNGFGDNIVEKNNSCSCPNGGTLNNETSKPRCEFIEEYKSKFHTDYEITF